MKILCRKSKKFYRWISKGKEKSFRTILDCTTTYGSGQDCIVAMVNSGDFTLEQAIWVYANACERCMNALCYKYLDGKEGYEEYSEEWKYIVNNYFMPKCKYIGHCKEKHSCNSQSRKEDD